MRGLAGVLERFSEGLRIRKILPSLLEEVRVTLILADLRLGTMLTECCSVGR